jgi:hypothetical protein
MSDRSGPEAGVEGVVEGNASTRTEPVVMLGVLRRRHR